MKQVSWVLLSRLPVILDSTENATPQINGGREFGSVITVTGTFGLMLSEYVIKNLIK